MMSITIGLEDIYFDMPLWPEFHIQYHNTTSLHHVMKYNRPCNSFAYVAKQPKGDYWKSISTT